MTLKWKNICLGHLSLKNCVNLERRLQFAATFPLLFPLFPFYHRKEQVLLYFALTDLFNQVPVSGALLDINLYIVAILVSLRGCEVD